MSRRTSSDFDLNHFKRRSIRVEKPQLNSLSSKIFAPVENEISLSPNSNSNSFTTALSLFLNRLPIAQQLSFEMPTRLKNSLRIQDKVDQMIDGHMALNNVVVDASVVTFSYTSIETPPVASSDYVNSGVSNYRKRDPLDLEGQLDKVQEVNEPSIFRGLKLFFFTSKKFDLELIKCFVYLTKKQSLCSEILIALAFALPYSLFSRNDLLVLLIVNCVVIYSITQMKKRYINKYYVVWNLLTLFIHQSMLVILDSVFHINENMVSTFLLLIFTSCSYVGTSPYPTRLIILYGFTLKALLFYFSGAQIQWETLMVTLFVDGFSAFIAVITNIRNVNFAYSNGNKLIVMKNLINDACNNVQKLDRIANSLLPDYVWTELKEGKHGAFTGNINKGLRYEYKKASMIFADVVGFTALSSKIDKDELLKILNHVFTRFDKIAEQYEMEKIKTVGDCYVVVGGITTESVDCAARCALMGLKMVEAMKEIQGSEIIPKDVVVALRIGAHVGSVTGGLIGDTKMLFDIWSRDVSIASLMEQSGMANRLHISQDFYDEISNFSSVELGSQVSFQDTKISTYFLESIKVNQCFFNLPFVKRKCINGKKVRDKSDFNDNEHWSFRGDSIYPLLPLQMTFKENQLESDFTRKRQKFGIFQQLSSLTLNFFLLLTYGTLILFLTEFNISVVAVLGLTIALQLCLLLLFWTVYYRQTVVFEQLKFVSRIYFRLGSHVERLKWDDIAIIELFQIYAAVMIFNFTNSFQIEFSHNSFYVCLLSGFIFQDIKFMYFILYTLILHCSYIYCLATSNIQKEDLLRAIFYFICASICNLNNYSINFLSRNFYSLEILNRERLYALQDQLQKTNKTVLKLLPPHVVEILKSGQTEFSESFPQCAVIFCEILGISNYPSNPDLLNEIISRIDKSLTTFPGVDKVKTIYSVYMAASGITPESRATEDHIQQALNFALSLKKQINTFKETGFYLNIKIGISVGPVIGGLVGKSKLTYDIWGDTVNVASRMESTADLQMIQVTQSLYHLQKEQYKFEERGAIHIKGKGIMTTFVLQSRKRRKEVMAPPGVG